MSRILKPLLAAIFCLQGTVEAETEHWAVYYNDKAPYAAFHPYSLLVLDSQVHPSLNPFIAAGKTTLGYVSLGEVAKHHTYFEQAQKAGLLFEENPNWPGSYFVDLRNPLWTKMLIEEIIPSVLYQRFDGLFFDTLDNALFLEQKDPVKHKGMVDAAVKLVKAIRLNYPHIPIMMNRGLALLPQVLNDINMLLAESTFTDYSSVTKTYHRMPKAEYRSYVASLKEIQKQNNEIKIFTLDYWDPADTKMIAEIYRVQREQGFIPYVSTPDLQTLIAEPKLL